MPASDPAPVSCKRIHAFPAHGRHQISIHLFPFTSHQDVWGRPKNGSAPWTHGPIPVQPVRIQAKPRTAHRFEVRRKPQIDGFCLMSSNLLGYFAGAFPNLHADRFRFQRNCAPYPRSSVVHRSVQSAFDYALLKGLKAPLPRPQRAGRIYVV